MHVWKIELHRHFSVFTPEGLCLRSMPKVTQTMSNLHQRGNQNYTHLNRHLIRKDINLLGCYIRHNDVFLFKKVLNFIFINCAKLNI